MKSLPTIYRIIQGPVQFDRSRGLPRPHSTAPENERYSADLADNTQRHKQFCLAKRKMDGFLRSPVQCATSMIACVCLQHQVNTNPFRGSRRVRWCSGSASACLCVCECVYCARCCTRAARSLLPAYTIVVQTWHTHTCESTGLRDRHRCGRLCWVRCLSTVLLASRVLLGFSCSVRATLVAHTHARGQRGWGKCTRLEWHSYQCLTDVCARAMAIMNSHTETTFCEQFEFHLFWEWNKKTTKQLWTFLALTETNSWILSVNSGDFGEKPQVYSISISNQHIP